MFALVFGLLKWDCLLLLPESELGIVTLIIACLDRTAFLSGFVNIGSDILSFLVA